MAFSSKAKNMKLNWKMYLPSAYNRLNNDKEHSSASFKSWRQYIYIIKVGNVKQIFVLYEIVSFANNFFSLTTTLQHSS